MSLLLLDKRLMPIQVLAPEVVSKIAAGEVVERPASVVKELVENSLDAGATQIGVEVRGGGIELIRVTDNGLGVPAREIELAFQRYATSKISQLADLERISTLGFRGEALPSIATVAEVEILTQSVADSSGTYLSLKNGAINRRESRARARGTTISVRQLFRNFPARLKFLKSPATENSYIAHLVSQYALAFPEIRFSLIINGRLVLNTSGNGNLRDVVVEVYGAEVAQKMLEVNNRDTMPVVSGLVSLPSLSRSSRGYFSFFVNRRWIQSRLLTKAVEQAYQGFLMSGKYPIVIISLSLPPEEIDVNVHPAKREVKFWHDQNVFIATQRAIRKALAAVPAPKFKTVPTPAILPSNPWVETGEKSALSLELPILRVVGQLANNYIITEGPEGLYLIDQHAAHERILYEKLLTQRSRQQVEVQGLLEPIVIELTPRQEEILRTKADVLNQFGFSIEPFGTRSYLIKTVPALIKEANLMESTKALMDLLTFKEASASWEEKIAQSLACHNAIKAGQILSNEEIRELVRQLEQTSQPRACPHARPTMVHLSSRQLEKEFGRMASSHTR